MLFDTLPICSIFQFLKQINYQVVTKKEKVPMWYYKLMQHDTLYLCKYLFDNMCSILLVLQVKLTFQRYWIGGSESYKNWSLSLPGI